MGGSAVKRKIFGLRNAIYGCDPRAVKPHCSIAGCKDCRNEEWSCAASRQEMKKHARRICGGRMFPRDKVSHKILFSRPWRNLKHEQEKFCWRFYCGGYIRKGKFRKLWKVKRLPSYDECSQVKWQWHNCTNKNKDYQDEWHTNMRLIARGGPAELATHPGKSDRIVNSNRLETSHCAGLGMQY